MKYLLVLFFIIVTAVEEEIDPAPGIIPFVFVAAVVDARTSDVVATAAVVSPHWVLTAAHLLPEDSAGVKARDFYVVAGRPLTKYQPSHVLIHPTYTWGLYTAEDFALFYVASEIDSKPVHLSMGRFPWNSVLCDFVYWKKSKYPHLNTGSLAHAKIEITVMQNCLIAKKKLPVGILEFYVGDLLCGTAAGFDGCAGDTGGILYCENLLVGLLIRKTWCENKTGNFTDVGVYFNWLYSRVGDGIFIQLAASAGGPSAIPECTRLITTALCIIRALWQFSSKCNAFRP